MTSNLKDIKHFIDNYNQRTKSLPYKITESIDILFDKEIWTFIQSIGFELKNRGKYFNPIMNIYYNSKDELMREIQRYAYEPGSEIINFFYNHRDKTKNIKKKETPYNNALNASVIIIVEAIKRFNQFRTVEYEFNPFLDNKVMFQELKMTIQSNKVLKDKEDLLSDIEWIKPKRYKEFVKDYNKHFSELIDFLEFILSIRFGADRKKGYLWIKAESDWGKSLLFNKILGEIQIITEIKETEIKASLKGSPVGLSMSDFLGSWILFVDEFKSAVSEIKDITHNLRFSPKGELRTTIPLYAKIFASAENVPSLTDGETMEQQFQNRFMMWELKGKITDRELFNNNKVEYSESIKIFVYEYLEKRIKEYKDLGIIQANKNAENKLNEIREKYHKKYLSIEDKIKEYAEEFKLYYERIIRDTLDIHYLDIMFIRDEDFYVSNKRKIIEAFSMYFFDDKMDAQIRKKDIAALLGISKKRETKRTRVEYGMGQISVDIKSGYKWFNNREIEEIRRRLINEDYEKDLKKYRERKEKEEIERLQDKEIIDLWL